MQSPGFPKIVYWANVSSNLVGSIRRTYLVLNWANFSSPTLVGRIRRSYIRGPKSFAQLVLGTFALFNDHWLRAKKI